MSSLPSDKKILFTGATGQALRPCAETMAADNEVWCLARFTKPETRTALEAKGIKTFEWTMGESSLAGLDDDFTHVVHAAPYRGQPDFDTASQANAVGAGMLMHHCRNAEAFLFVSTFGVYAKPSTPEHPVAETDPLGGYTPYAPSYGLGKLAAEGAVRAFARVLDLPTTIARLNVCYGPTGWGGLPVEFFGRVVAGEPIWMPPGGNPIPSSPISTDDVTHFIPGLWDAASPSTTIVNLAGDETTSVQEFMAFLAGEAGLDANFVHDERARESFVSDNTRRKSLVGECSVHWREGMARAVEAHYPGAFSGEPITASLQANIWDQR
jgi:nucleoside-diphosphate-sugar epimerase